MSTLTAQSLALTVSLPDTEVAEWIAQLVKCHSACIGAVLQRLGVARGDVDDARQRVWLTALRYSGQLQSGRERAFLLAVARGEASHARRSYRRRGEVNGVEFDTFESSTRAADEILAHRERLRQARSVLEGLDAGQRELLVCLETGEASARDVARRLGIPVGTAKSRLRRARRECTRLGQAFATG